MGQMVSRSEWVRWSAEVNGSAEVNNVKFKEIVDKWKSGEWPRSGDLVQIRKLTKNDENVMVRKIW